MSIRNYFKVLLVYGTLCMFGCTSAQAKQNQQVNNSHKSRELVISFDFKRGGIASSQYAIWIEDTKGNLVRTLYATSFTAKGGYTYREDAIPLWVGKSNLSKMSARQVDGITGATPKNGRLIYIWDGKNDVGKALPKGIYHFYVEGTCYWKSRILYVGSVEWMGENQPNIKIQQKRFHQSANNTDMITNVKAQYK